MSLENERRKCQLPSCENRRSIKDRVLKILAREYMYSQRQLRLDLEFPVLSVLGLSPGRYT